MLGTDFVENPVKPNESNESGWFKNLRIIYFSALAGIFDWKSPLKEAFLEIFKILLDLPH